MSDYYSSSEYSSRAQSPVPWRKHSPKVIFNNPIINLGQAIPKPAWQRFAKGVATGIGILGGGAGIYGLNNYLSTRKAQPVKLVPADEAPKELYGRCDSECKEIRNGTNYEAYGYHPTPTPTPEPEENKGTNPMNEHSMNN